MKFEEKLGFWGKKKFKTYVNFAKELEISPPSLQRYLSGEQKPGFKILSKLYELGCDLNWLFDKNSNEFEAESNVTAPQIQLKIIRLESENKELKELVSDIEGRVNSYLSKSLGS